MHDRDARGRRRWIRLPWKLARWLVRLEIGIWRSLFLLLTGRRPGQDATTSAHPHHRQVQPILLVFAFVSALEIPVVHLLLPWDTLRLGLLAVGVWGVLWLLGYAAALRVFPHVVGPTGLRVRSGATLDVGVPWSAVEDVRLQRSRVQRDRLQVVDGVAMVPVLNQLRVRVELCEPIEFPLSDGRLAVHTIVLYADDAEALVAACRRHLAAARPEGKAGLPRRSSGSDAGAHVQHTA